VVVQEGSVSSPKVVEEAFVSCQPTHVIHLAASYQNPLDWKEDVSTNIQGMVNVVKASESHEISRFINIQTVLCYGRPTQIPIAISEPLKPESSYAISKVAAENYLLLSELSFASMRLGNVVSPGLAIGPIPNFYKNLMEGNESTATKTIRDFLDIDDFLDALSLLMKPDAPSGVFNISSGKGVAMPEIFGIVSKHLNKDSVLKVSDPQPDDIPEIVLDPKDTERRLGWKAKVPLEESIGKCIESYSKNGLGKIYTHLKKTVR
jgi:nucleoside-diphosphate-sugar epimerase